MRGEFAKFDKLRCTQARYAARAAQACGYSFATLDGADGYLFEVRDGARKAVFAAGAGSPYAMNDARAASLARDKGFCAEALRGAGVPVLPGEMYFVTPRWAELRGPGREREDALAYVAAANAPLFCKPIAGSNGRYCEVVESVAEFADYLERVACEHYAVLVQPYVRAAEYRVFVLQGQALFSYRKQARFVVGDGERTLGDLLHGRARARDEAGRRLAHGDRLARGARAYLEGPTNRSAGGGAEELREGAPEALASLALAAADAIGLRLAGVDIFARSEDLSGLIVIEVNSNPMIATLEDHGRFDLIETIWRANFEASLR